LGIIMDSETDASPSRMPTLDEFRRLLYKYRVLISQLRLASKDFGDLSHFPMDHIAGALVVQEACAELHGLYDKFHEWAARQEDRRKEITATATQMTAVGVPTVSLLLNGYAPDKKVKVIRVLRETLPGCSLTKAKALAEQDLPAPIANGLPLERATAMRQKFEAIGAVCRISATTS
jgi:ribosomal protein L7/L12